ncbi:cytochrome b [Agarivorans sp. Toyoura001]|uniref:cytochrome b n=1 Tax=Agarivorans sp. Toyoura001 TaxID=2283141 RepID=UPI0010ECA222|nr:cytochrome b [Agarivorans sp. Toyoura001]GDY26892.1 cytochrome b [Agarivorans sp. Toyoura001]
MSIRNTEQGYGWVAIGLHWLVALSVFGLFGLGLFMVDLNYYSSWYQTAPMIHKSVGILLFMVMLFRLLWRGLNPHPVSPENHQQWEKTGAKVGHFLLYLILFCLMISGYLISTADGRAISVFEWFEIPATVTGINQQEELAGDVHEILAWTLIALVAGHGLAALKHHFIDKDSTLVRMLKPTK